ncbi:hypothetical protein CEXT_683731 [Caerostris extrusa]|uniref:Uncharacterized protein n=1 Tax=Caerostris extrusa TaxID=172846 RepID=A0AAV4M295_CAEEX|nr:hypothetical protein CEXT_683731 [Caerostris extrusa]
MEVDDGCVHAAGKSHPHKGQYLRPRWKCYQFGRTATTSDMNRDLLRLRYHSIINEATTRQNFSRKRSEAQQKKI